MQARTLLLLLLLCFSCMVARAQQDYQWHATVPAPAQQGFHSILLPPEVTGRLRPDLADLRLYKGTQEVPYLLRKSESLAPIPVQQTTRTDSAQTKQTHIHLQFEQPAYPEQLELTIAAPDLYHRQAKVLLGEPSLRQRIKRRRRDRGSLPSVATFTISSDKPAKIELPRQQVEELTLIIENEDNPPLEVADIKALQFNRYLVAKLDAGESYTLLFGNKAATAPTYDLQFFRDSIPDELPVLAVTDISAAQAKQKPGGPVSKAWVWAAISVVVIGLSYMTVRLLNEINQEKK